MKQNLSPHRITFGRDMRDDERRYCSGDPSPGHAEIGKAKHVYHGSNSNRDSCSDLCVKNEASAFIETGHSRQRITVTNNRKIRQMALREAT